MTYFRKEQEGSDKEPEVHPQIRNLYDGLRREEDPVTWRTSVIEMARYLGAKDPERDMPTASLQEATRLVNMLTEGTHFHPIVPEILYSLGYEIQTEGAPLKALIVNARNQPEWLFWRLADEIKSQGKNVAVLNPNGHYSDRQPRVVGLPKLFRDVNTAAFISSTQQMYGGNLSSLFETMEILRNPYFSCRIGHVAVIIPMFGGSRGHKLGQSGRRGYEVLQTLSVPKRMANFAEDIQGDLASQGCPAPEFSFCSIDIHNRELPGSQFTGRETNYDFLSISPALCFAREITNELKYRNSHLYGLPIRVIAVDEGAETRSIDFAGNLLLEKAGAQEAIEVILMKKYRDPSGDVTGSEIKRALSCSLVEGKLNLIEISAANIQTDLPYIRITSDDILDSGKSANKDDIELDKKLPGAKLKIAVVTHPVMSKGVRQALDFTGSDVVFVGNTITNPELVTDYRIRVVDLSPAIVETILQGD